MFLFSRRARLAGGRTQESLRWAAEITDAVNEHSTVPMTLWSGILGPEVGTLAWSAFVPDLTSVQQTMDRLAADESFVALADTGASLLRGGVDDTLAQIVHGEPNPGRDVNYVAVVQAVCANRNLGRGLSIGVEIAQMAEKITGTATMFGSSVTGPYGGVAWLTGFETIAELEARQQALATDAGWLDVLDREAGTAYQEGAELTTSRLYRRIA
jgi:hypothetical protein